MWLDDADVAAEAELTASLARLSPGAAFTSRLLSP